MSLRLPRWTALLALPLLIGALLIMHGLDAKASANSATTAHASVEATSHSHGHPAQATSSERGCDHCTAGHLMAACTAVIVTVGAIRLRRSTTLGRLAVAPHRVAAGSLKILRDVVRPPEPAWVRLGVMLH